MAVLIFPLAPDRRRNAPHGFQRKLAIHQPHHVPAREGGFEIFLGIGHEANRRPDGNSIS